MPNIRCSEDTLKIKALHAFKMLETTCPVTHDYMPEDLHPPKQCSEKLTCHIKLIIKS